MLPSRICPECSTGLADGARKCRCGWTISSITSRTTPALEGAQQIVPIAERLEVKRRIEERRLELKRRPQPDWLSHWKQILEKPGATVAQKLMAEEAIATLEGKRCSYVMGKR